MPINLNKNVLKIKDSDTNEWTGLSNLVTQQIDSTLSETSTNPIQNATVTKKLNQLSEELDRIFEDVLTEVETVLSSGTNKTLTLGIDYKAGDTLKFECLTDNTGVAEISYEIYMEPSEPDEDDDLIEEAGMGFVTIDPMIGSEKSYTKMTVNSTMLSFSVNGYVTAYRIDYKNASGSEIGGDGTDNSAVKYEPQELADDQKAQARTNIGAASEADKITISYDAENKIVRFLRAGGTLLELPSEKVGEYYKLLTDTDLTAAGVPADAAAVGERFDELSQEIYQNGMAINELSEGVGELSEGVGELSEGVGELSEGVGELSEKVNNYTETLLCTGAKTTLTLGEDYNVGDTLKFECLSADADFVEIFCATSTEGNFESITIDPTSDETAYVTVIVEDDMLSFTVNKVVTVYRIYSKVLIDSELSEESTNPVQNKVVAKKITEITNEISQLGQEKVDLNQGAENVGKILVVGTDGKLTLMDMPSGSSGDVTGVVDEANNILLTGNLADGTYTLKYENADGTYTEIGTLEVSAIPEPEPIYTNFAEPNATNTTDFTIWCNDARFGSDGTYRKEVGTVTTNYVSVEPNDIIEVTGIKDNSNNQATCSADKTKTWVWKYSAPASYVSDITNTDSLIQFTTIWETGAFVRISGALTGTLDDVVIKIKRNGEYL